MGDLTTSRGSPVGAVNARVWLALWVVYLVWGSTYLAIRVAVHPTHGNGFPPLLMAGTRFAFSGLLLLAVTARRPAPDGRPDPLGARQWAAAAVIGTALLLGGNGLVSIAEQRIASGERKNEGHGNEYDESELERAEILVTTCYTESARALAAAL